MQTFITTLAAARAMPRPMPSDDAVMYATLPLSTFSGAGCDTVGSGGGAGRAPGVAAAPGGAPAGAAFWATAYWLSPIAASRLTAPAPVALSCRNRRRSAAKRSAREDGRDSFLDVR